ncbi:hypothetical protein H1R20_g4863, partial [Candolleomyces eurysporus]
MSASALIASLLTVLTLTSTSLGVTIYGQLPLGQTQTEGPWATTTALAAYNDTRLIPPAVPNPAINRNFAVQLQRDAAQVPGLSLPHVGPSFYGFSIEMSVITQVLGKNSSFIQVPFLNLMANLQERAGGVLVRLGGNTQEFATMVEPDDHRIEPGHTFGKTLSGSTQTTLTPAVLYTRDMFYMANNISSMVNVKWFLGIPFNDSTNWRTAIAEEGQSILGDHLLGLQAANEPDFYVTFGRRVAPYEPADYKREVGELIKHLETRPMITNPRILVGPSTSGQVWHAEQVFETGFLDDYKDYLYAVSVEHYPNNNCIAMYGDPHSPDAVIPQELFPYYLNHNNVVELASHYTANANTAATYNKPFIMFEMNTGSCGGFAGISDTYTAALWALDYGFQMASQNTTHALLHVGGQSVFYNPFTAPPSNQTEFNEWTLGPVYYSALVMAEAFGKSNTSQIIDLRANENNQNTPVYGIFERGQLSKVALFNYIDDPSGANDLRVALTVNGGVPASVSVKYLEGISVNEKNNITWAGQTFGNKLTVDGRLRGTLNVTTIPCDQGQNVCTIPLRAPSFALVFFSTSDEALSISQSPTTFSTSAYQRKHNTITWDRQAVQTSNGHVAGELKAKLGSTSFGFLNIPSGAAPSLSGRGGPVPLFVQGLLGTMAGLVLGSVL